MNFANTYFKRFKICEQFASNAANCNASIIIVIPICNEPNLLKTLSCFENQSGEYFNTLILCVINDSANATDEIIKQNQKSLQELQSFSRIKLKNIQIAWIYLKNISEKQAGVGFARKAGMDEAIRIFNTQNNPNGIIVSLDADCIIDNNYLISISDFFSKNPKYKAATIYFEHPINGSDYNEDVYYAVANYELHLRCFRYGLEIAGYPYPIHTIGSCFAVLAKAYISVGGMNTKQGGEDFYFLHKLTTFTQIPCITTTTIHPSPRVSDRVPFGTGPAIKKALNGENIETYNAKLYLILKKFFANFPKWYNVNITQIETDLLSLNPYLAEYCIANGFLQIISECKQNTENVNAFVKRLFSRFNAFSIIKFLNNSSISLYPKQEPECAARMLLSLNNKDCLENKTVFDLLNEFRQLELNR